MDTTFHCTSTVFFRETTFALLELTDRLRLFLLRCPLQFDFHVQTSVGFQISLKNKVTNGKSRSYHLIWSLGNVIFIVVIDQKNIFSLVVVATTKEDSQFTHYFFEIFKLQSLF